MIFTIKIFAMDKDFAPLKFTDDLVNGKFEALTDIDYTIQRPKQKYHGPLSAINVTVAEAMVEAKSNLLKVREIPVATPATAPVKPEKPVKPDAGSTN